MRLIVYIITIIVNNATLVKHVEFVKLVTDIEIKTKKMAHLGRTEIDSGSAGTVSRMS